MPKKYIAQRMQENEAIPLRQRWNRLKLRFTSYAMGKLMIWCGLSSNYKTANCISMAQMQGFAGVPEVEGVQADD